MVQITGAYKLEKNENLDEFYQNMGVPWMARKIMCSSTPIIHMSKDEEETWVFKTVTFFRTIDISFKLDQEYEEAMPSGNTYQSITTMQGDNLFITKSRTLENEVVGDNVAFERHYEFNDDGLIMILKSPSSEVVAKRYFKRLPQPQQ